MRGDTSRSFGSPLRLVAGSADSGVHSCCFADEVVIDFPSIAPVVDRIRRGFLAGERAAALSATVELSLEEAMEGAMVPLDVAVPSTCPSCDGRGETWTEPCLHCQGSGARLRRHRVRVVVPAGVLDGARFDFTVVPRHDPPARVELRVRVA
jgi:hypothetical protein